MSAKLTAVGIGRSSAQFRPTSRAEFHDSNVTSDAGLLPFQNGQIADTDVVRDGWDAGSTAQPACGLPGNPAVRYRPRRSRIHLRNVGFDLPKSKAGCYALYVNETDKIWA